MRKSVNLCVGKQSKAISAVKAARKFIGVVVPSHSISYQGLPNSKLPHHERIALQEFNKLIEASRKRKVYIINKAISRALKASENPKPAQLKIYESNKIKAQAELEKIQKIVPSVQLPVSPPVLSPPKHSKPNDTNVKSSLRRQAQEAQATVAFQKLVENISMTRKGQIENILSKLTKDITSQPSQKPNENLPETTKLDEPLMHDRPEEENASKDSKHKKVNSSSNASADTSQISIEGKAESTQKPSKSHIQRDSKSKSELHSLKKVRGNANRERFTTPRNAPPSKPVDLNMKDDHSDRERATYFNLLKQQVGEQLSNTAPGGAAGNNSKLLANSEASPLGFPRNPTGLFRL